MISIACHTNHIYSREVDSPINFPVQKRLFRTLAWITNTKLQKSRMFITQIFRYEYLRPNDAVTHDTKSYSTNAISMRHDLCNELNLSISKNRLRTFRSMGTQTQLLSSYRRNNHAQWCDFFQAQLSIKYEPRANPR